MSEHESVAHVTAAPAARRAIAAVRAGRGPVMFVHLVLDVEAGESGGFSLAPGDGLHFNDTTPRTEQEKQP